MTPGHFVTSMIRKLPAVLLDAAALHVIKTGLDNQKQACTSADVQVEILTS